MPHTKPAADEPHAPVVEGSGPGAAAHFRSKLALETDSADVFAALEAAASTGQAAGIVLVDARIPEAYGAGHVPGAINLPHRLMTAASTADLPRDKVIVVYCDGVGCNASTKGALRLAELGFTVKEMPGGLDWWRQDGYPVAIGGAPGQIAGGIRCGC